MAVRVKICGLTNVDDALAAVAGGADALGFVFVPGTPRAVTAEHVGPIVRALPPFVAKVGLFVDADAATVQAVLAQTGLDTLQLHGDETPEFCRQFLGRVKVVKAYRVRGAETLAQLPDYADSVDAFLLDAFVPRAHGGTGARFDWEHAVAAKALGRPIVLAGGLTPDNVAEAVRTARPYAVDVSGGVESAPGRKDSAKLRQFIAAAKGA